jgi:hypothetical protein
MTKVKPRTTMDTLLNRYKYDDACRAGADCLSRVWHQLELDSSAPYIRLTKKRTLRPLYLGVFIMREQKRGGTCYYSVVTQQEVENETVMATNIPETPDD